MANQSSHFISALFCEVYVSSQLDWPRSAISTLQWLLRSTIHHGLSFIPAADLNFCLDVVLSIMNQIKFTIQNPDDFSSTTLQSLQEMQNNIASLEARHDVIGSRSEVAEERSRRTQRCYQYIIRLFEESKLHSTGRTNNNRTFNNVLDVLTVEPDQTAFSTLRDIYRRRHVSSPSGLLLELRDFFTRLYNEKVIISTHAADTAGLAVVAIMHEIVNQLRGGVGSPAFFTEEVCHELISFLTTMVDSASQSDNFKCLAEIRYSRLRILFKAASEIPLITVFRSADYLINQQIVASCPTSALWQKLDQTESIAALIGRSEVGSCSICLEDIVAQVNFAILDQCNHLFCKECIETWFTDKTTCPYCRSSTLYWTAKDEYLAFKEARRLSGGNSS